MDIEKRLEELKNEYEAGQKMLAELETKRANVTNTLLRIEGAMQILRELADERGGKSEPVRNVSAV